MPVTSRSVADEYVPWAIAVTPVHGGLGWAAAPGQPLNPDDAMAGLRVRHGALDPNVGVTLAIVPDGVTRVAWSFSGAGVGVRDPHPSVLHPAVVGNVAVVAVTRAQGPLTRVSWTHADASRMVGSSPGPSYRASQIVAINASRSHRVAPQLRADFALFRTVAADDPAKDWAMPVYSVHTPGQTSTAPNYWQTRYLPVSGVDGRGLWITPGTRGVCFGDPGGSGCAPLQPALTSAGLVDGGAIAHGQESFTALAPDGNSTVTLLLSGGGRRTVRVLDHNVVFATVPGQVTGLIDRGINGKITHDNLR